jgi:hypothetical protein
LWFDPSFPKAEGGELRGPCLSAAFPSCMDNTFPVSEIQTFSDTVQTKHPSHIHRPRVSPIDSGNGARLSLRYMLRTTRPAVRLDARPSLKAHVSSITLGPPNCGKVDWKNASSIDGMAHPMSKLYCRSILYNWSSCSQTRIMAARDHGEQCVLT